MLVQIYLLSLIFSLKSIKIKELDTSYQIRKQLIILSENEMPITKGFRYGLWSKYNPLINIPQIGIVGQFDSNCLLLHSGTEKNTQSLNLIYYDCLDYDSKKIKKIITFIDNNNEEHIFSKEIDCFEYENFWYFLMISQWPQQQKFELIFMYQEQTLLHSQLQIKRPFKDTEIILTFGGSMIVSQSKISSKQQGTKFSYFPGKLILYEFEYDDILFMENYEQIQQAFLEQYNNCMCQENYKSEIDNFDINQQQNLVFVSENINCNSFILSGWSKINEIIKIQDEFIYQLLILTSNFQNSLADYNLSPFSLSYKVSSIQNQIILTTYSYTFPSVTIDFSSNPFLIKKVFDITNSITLWHNIYVKLKDDQLIFQIQFFEGNQIYDYKFQIQVFQFKQTQYKLQYGNNLQSKDNYLNVQLRNFKFYNCDIEFYQQNCHYSCEDCEGPNRDNCLSCKKGSLRIYLTQFKACICPYYTRDDDICQSYQDHNLQIIQNKQQNRGCQYGYFEYSDNCYLCPSIIKDSLVTCLECIQNSKGWINDPKCDGNLYLNQNGQVQKIFSEQSFFYFVFDGNNLIYCKDCDKTYSFILKEYNVNETVVSIFSKKYFCFGTPLNCEFCLHTIYGNICLECYYDYILIQGVCTSLIQDEMKFCTPPFYLTLRRQCQLCNIKYCKYCFEYLRNDLTTSTLYRDFEFIDRDEEIILGCALCEDHYIYDFDNRLCLYQQPKILNCQRSFILDSKEICTLSVIDDFNLANEIINCQKYQLNCLQCILSLESTVKCIVCEVGYTASIKNGGCHKSDPIISIGAKIIIEGSQKLSDAWIQRIQSFILKFLPNQYFYPQSFDIQEQAVECLDGFKLTESSCYQYCDQNCQSCVYNEIQGFMCTQCPLNYFYQPIRDQINGTCSECPYLCQACQSRSKNEIYVIYLCYYSKAYQPTFQLNSDNFYLTKKCIKPVSDPNVYLDLENLIARYCFDELCSSTFLYEIDYDYCEFLDTFWEKAININYLNQIGIHTLIIKFNLTSILPCLFINLWLHQSLQAKIFSLKSVQYVITTQFNLIFQLQTPICMDNIDTLIISNLIQKRIYNDEFIIQNNKTQTHLKIMNMTIIDSNVQNSQSQFQTEIYGDCQFNNVSIINSTLMNSSFLSVDQSTINGAIKIDILRIKNCSLKNSQLFQLTNNQIILNVENLLIEDCVFSNSTIFFVKTPLNQLSSVSFKSVIIKNSVFQKSSFLNCFGYVILQMIDIKLISTYLQQSNLIAQNYNLSIYDFQIYDIDMKESQLISIIEQNYNSNVLITINNFVALQIQIMNSNLLKIYSNQEFSYIFLDIQNQKFEEIRGIRISEFSSYLFFIKCFLFTSSNITFHNLNNAFIFYIYDSNTIIFQNIIYEQLDQQYKVLINQNCKTQIMNQNQLMKIVNFYSFKLSHVQIFNQFTIDKSILDLSPKELLLNSVNIKIQLIDIIFKGNLQIHQQSSTSFSLLVINSERNIDITISNIQFLQNIFHSQLDYTFLSYASLIYINSQSSTVEIFNFSSHQNVLTNSSNSFIYINSMNLIFYNYTASNHNVLSSDLLSQYYDLQFDSILDQEQLNQFISETLFIKNIGGVAKIIASTFICQKCHFQNILAFKSVIFEITTEYKGIVRITELTANNLQSDLNQQTNNSGCISIYSQNSILDLQISNSTFSGILNRISSSILTIQSSNIQNTISFYNIQIKNCLSLINQILFISFSKKIIQNNKLYLKNIVVLQDEESWNNFLNQVKFLSITELSGISSNENALIYIESCSVSLQNITFEGLYISSILILVNTPQLQLQNTLITYIQAFYSFPLVKIIQKIEFESKVIIQQLRIQNYTNYQVNDRTIQFSNYYFSSIGCSQIYTYLPIDKQQYYLSDFFKSIEQQSQKQSTLISISSQSNKHSFYFNQVNLINNNCTLCNNGLISFDLQQYYQIKIIDFNCLYNQVQQYGCLNFATLNELYQPVQLYNSKFIKNIGSRGIGISSFEVPILIKSCKMIFNLARYEGGGLYMEMKNSNFSIKNSIITQNQAREGGGIYISQDANLNHENSIKNYLILNHASLYGNNLVAKPNHMALVINSVEMPSQNLNTEQIQTKILDIKPYTTVEQEKKIKTKYLMLPSNQALSQFSIIVPRSSQKLVQISQLSLIFKNSLNEMLLNMNTSTCAVMANIIKLDKTKINGFLQMKTLMFDINYNGFDLTSLTFQLDPYNKDYQYLQTQFICQTSQKNYLNYFIQSTSYKCQLGEFYVDFGCQRCLPIQRFYSVTYDSIKCSIFDKEKFLDITQNSIQLKIGYWRPNYLSDYTVFCFKNANNCGGGWTVGDNSCSEGHVGAMCEECDIYNIRGFGKHFKTQTNSECVKCFGIKDSVLPVFFNILWALLSIIITLRSIEKSNELFLLLKIRERFSKILFKLNQDLQSIFVKMFLNYLWIFSVIFTFNLNFSFSIDFINQASNASYSMVNNLDCYLSEIQQIELIYFKVIVILILIIWQFIIIIFGYLMYTFTTKNQFKLSIISNTLLCLYVFNFTGFIKILCSLISVREISNIQYIQGDLTQLFYTQQHQIWMLYLVLPGLIIIGLVIPICLFSLMYFKQNQLNKSKLRPHICYLYNEYESTCYFWEQLKLSKKAIIILFLTYFETRIALKASLIGLILLYYQRLALNKKPYILSNLNRLDLKAGYICSFSIFLAAIKYENESVNNSAISIIFQIVIIALFFILVYKFIHNIALIYIKKYKLVLIKYLYETFKILKMKKISNKLQGFLNEYNKKSQRIKENITKIRMYLLLVSKDQIKNRSTLQTKMLSTPIPKSRLLSAEFSQQQFILTRRYE